MRFDFIKAYKDGGDYFITEFHCRLPFYEIKHLNECFHDVSIEDFGRDGEYVLEVIYNKPEFLYGEEVNAAWYDFKVIAFEPRYDGPWIR